MSKARGDKAKCDVLFSQRIRSVGRCEKCGSVLNLQCAHVISRRYAHVRTDERNAVCLCAKDHAYFTDHPVEFAAWIVPYLGADVYAELHAKSHLRTKFDWTAELARLRESARTP